MRPRIRSIKPELWQDEKIVALSRDARLLLLGLMTMADDEGRFRARRSTIYGHVFPGDDEALDLIDGWVGEIKEQTLVLFYVTDGTPYGAFRHWRKHQKINKPSPSDLPPPPDPKVVRDNRVKRTGAISDHSRNGHVELPESSGSVHSSARRRALRSDPDPDQVVVIEQLCDRLAERIRANDPKANPKPDTERWQNDLRLLINDRGGDVAEVERIIDWCQADSFWRSNILSPKKLRDQFTALKLRADGEVVPIRGGRIQRKQTDSPFEPVNRLKHQARAAQAAGRLDEAQRLDRDAAQLAASIRERMDEGQQSA